jgi:hypothetical protein
MHDALHELQNVTQQCVATLDTMDYDAIQRFLLAREQLIAKIRQLTWTAEEMATAKPLIAEVLSHDTAILQRMRTVQSQAGMELGKMNIAKKQRQSYDRVFQQTDVNFFDQRK